MHEPERQTIIEVNGVTKQFGDYIALQDITFSVKKGELLALIGPNGSGKSTLAKMIVGLETPTEGTVTIYGKSPGQNHRRLGYVPQLFSFDRTLPMTVKEFLDLIPCETPRHGHVPNMEHLFDAVGIQALLQRQLGKLSGGQLQRVLIARALLHERDILVLDEPSAGVDVGGERAIYELLKELNEQHAVTVIVISHELDFIMRYATTVLCVNQHLICHGLPKEALTGETLEALYGKHMKHVHHHYQKKV